MIYHSALSSRCVSRRKEVHESGATVVRSPHLPPVVNLDRRLGNLALPLSAASTSELTVLFASQKKKSGNLDATVVCRKCF